MNTPTDTAGAEPNQDPPASAPNGANPPTPGALVNPNNPPWGNLAAFVTWIVSILAVAVVPVILVRPYVSYHYNGQALPTMDALLANKTFVFLLVLGWLPAHLLTLVLIWAVGTRLGRYSLKDVFGLSWSADFSFAKSVAVAVGLFAVAFLIAAMMGGQGTDLDQIIESSRAAALTVALIAVATAPLVEELIYRGLLYSAMQRVIGKWFAVIVVASMFAGLHVYQYRRNLGVILSISLLSFVLTYIRARTGRLLACFVIHLVFNGVQSFLIVLEPYLRAMVERYRPHPTTGVILYFFHFLQ